MIKNYTHALIWFKNDYKQLTVEQSNEEGVTTEVVGWKPGEVDGDNNRQLQIQSFEIQVVHIFYKYFTMNVDIRIGYFYIIEYKTNDSRWVI